MQIRTKRYPMFKTIEPARVMQYINTRIDDEFYINVQWLLHQVKLLFPVRPRRLPSRARCILRVSDCAMSGTTQ
jgi:hypothetical protein